MLDASGNNWETQSSAFTETLKAKLLGYNSFYNNTGKLEFITNSFWWIGQAYNITNLAASTLYQPSGFAGKKNIGEWVYAFVSGGSSLFGSNGAYLLNDNPFLTLVFEMDFTAGTSGVFILTSKIIVENSVGTVVAQTLDAGVYYNARQTLNYRYMYTTAPLRYTLNQGDKIFVDTVHNILTPNSTTIAGVTMKAKFSMIGN